MKGLILLLCWFISFSTFARCVIYDSGKRPVSKKSDALFMILSGDSACPQNVFEFKESIEQKGLSIDSFMVANRGRNNPKHGSFSIFESVSGSLNVSRNSLEVKKGMFYFGHFTGLKGREVVFDQTPSRSKLLIELIAWDYVEKVFNFYELLSVNNKSIWFYRGDSKDILLDNQKLHLQRDPANPEFGRRLRCSACHTSGGPIMKELEAPHNDWWVGARKLEFGPNHLSYEVKSLLGNIQDATELSKLVKKSIDSLTLSKEFWSFKKQTSLKEVLRPLFCTQEINLVSDGIPLQSSTSMIELPISFLINPLLYSTDKKMRISKSGYLNILRKFKVVFPENGAIDADHAFLAPVKGHADLVEIKALVNRGVIDRKFVKDVLAVDYQNPTFSQKRCSLLRLVPNSSNWKHGFIESLKKTNSMEAKELLQNMTDKNKTESYYNQMGISYLREISLKLKSDLGIENIVKKLYEVREQVKNSEISQNPLGQILEPGFRVIFPTANMKRR
ncbi:MAG: hypothetical protein H6620_05315 [Halobacteriovoraceae bacterium]|nr:hypothetical protein [Halobacteriovoraceae bacterium]